MLISSFFSLHCIDPIFLASLQLYVRVSESPAIHDSVATMFRANTQAREQLVDGKDVCPLTALLLASLSLPSS